MAKQTKTNKPRYVELSQVADENQLAHGKAWLATSKTVTLHKVPEEWIGQFICYVYPTPEQLEKTDMNLTPKERSDLRKALIAAGQPTRGMDDEQLKNAVKQLGAAPQPAPAASDPRVHKPAPAPQPATPAPTNRSPLEQAIHDVIDQRMQGFNPTQAIDEDAVRKLIEEHSSTPRRLDITVKTLDGKIAKQITGAHAALPDALDVVQLQRLTGQYGFLTGPSGSGKSHLAGQLADALDLKLYQIPPIQEPHEIWGYNDISGNYVPGFLYEPFKNGGLVFLDEFDGSDATAALGLNAPLANRRATFPNGETLTMHDDCVIIAAGNTIGSGATMQFIGRNPLDGATRQRFQLIHVDYDLAIEDTMVETALAATEASPEQRETAHKCLAAIRIVRDWVEAERHTVLVTPRDSQQAAALAGKGWSFAKIMESRIYMLFSDDQVRRLTDHVERALPAANVIQKRAAA